MEVVLESMMIFVCIFPPAPSKSFVGVISNKNHCSHAFLDPFDSSEAKNTLPEMSILLFEP